MSFYLIGVDYRIADIQAREAILRQKEEIADFLATSYKESAIFTTCNRFEIYVTQDKQPPEDILGNSAYSLNGEPNVFRHALRLACGLESQLKGELEILEQINSWRSGITGVLSKFWQEVYLQALRIRAISGLNNPEINLANAVYEDIEKILGVKDKEAIIIGTGKIAELFAAKMPESVKLTFASHKNKSRAQVLAKNTGGSFVALREIKGLLSEIDFIISATKSSHYILKEADVRESLSRRAKPLYIYDLAIPRDIEPAVKNLRGVVLKNLDDLSANFEELNFRIKDKLSLAAYLIEEKVNGYTYRLTQEPLGVEAG